MDRLSFDQAAQDYDAIRPGYPQALIEDIVSLSALPPSGRILEIGCGTGQATITAFHWIPAEVGYPKVARILKNSGYAAIFSQSSSDALHRFLSTGSDGIPARRARME